MSSESAIFMDSHNSTESAIFKDNYNGTESAIFKDNYNSTESAIFKDSGRYESICNKVDDIYFSMLSSNSINQVFTYLPSSLSAF